MKLKQFIHGDVQLIRRSPQILMIWWLSRAEYNSCALISDSD